MPEVPTDAQLARLVLRLKRALFLSRVGEGRALAKLTDNLFARKPRRIAPGRTQRRER